MDADAIQRGQPQCSIREPTGSSGYMSGLCQRPNQNRRHARTLFSHLASTPHTRRGQFLGREEQRCAGRGLYRPAQQSQLARPASSERQPAHVDSRRLAPGTNFAPRASQQAHSTKRQAPNTTYQTHRLLHDAAGFGAGCEVGTGGGVCGEPGPCGPARTPLPAQPAARPTSTVTTL